MPIKIKPAFTFRILVLSALLAHFETSCQNTSRYEQGIILMQNGDTLNCLVPISLSYEEEISIKLDGETVVLPINSIKYLSHSDMWFERVDYTHKKNNYQKLMKILSFGTINLYVEIPSDLSSHRLDLKYFAKKRGILYALSDGNYKKKMATLVSDSPPATEFFIRTKYKIEKLLEVIEYYNLQRI